jgi:hypothetical protein
MAFERSPESALFAEGVGPVGWVCCFFLLSLFYVGSHCPAAGTPVPSQLGLQCSTRRARSSQRIAAQAMVSWAPEAQRIKI